MAILTIKNLLLRFGGPPLLDHASFTLEAGERLCLMGRNGEGKSTILKILSGDLEPNSMEFIRKPNLRIARLMQEVPSSLPGRVRDIVAGGFHAPRTPQGATPPGLSLDMARLLSHPGQYDLLDWEHQQMAEVSISRLGLDPDQHFDALSGGQKRRTLLARALVCDPDLLLLDEPTNHLDIPSITWLEELLVRLPCALLFVSHDRSFVRKVATRILELDRGQIRSWDCTYDRYIERREALLADEEKANALFDKRLAEEEVWIRKGIKARRTRNEGRVRALLRMREERRNRRERQGSVQMEISEAERSGKLVIKAQNLSFRWPDRSIAENFQCSISRGDRIGIVGANGSGKTTLLRLLLGELSPQEGQVQLGTNLQVAYFDQMRSQLKEAESLIENIGDGKEYIEIGSSRKHVMSYLGDFLFSGDRARGPITALSGGERNRLLLARLFSRPSNVLVLDEPTNDLDMETLDLLEELLADYAGTVLCVSHDRDFLDRICSSLIVLESPGVVREFVGGYADYKQVRDAELARSTKAKEEPQSTTSSSAVPSPSAASKRKLSFKEQREYDSLPDQIERLESEVESIQAELAKPEIYTDHILLAKWQSELSTKEEQLLNAYNRWTELSP